MGLFFRSLLRHEISGLVLLPLSCVRTTIMSILQMTWN